MRFSVYIETPFGDFQFARTDFSKGDSCSQCALNGLDHCHEIECNEFDTELRHFHLVRRYEK